MTIPESRVALVISNGKIVSKTVPMPKIAPDEVLIKVHAIGLK
jgi:NADPH:quinone reductase-like Zn-dependent oxidoreductase